MKNCYFLKDRESGSYYMEEGYGTFHAPDALTFSTIDELLIRIPLIMRDWNWDYDMFYANDKGEYTRVPDGEWMPLFYKKYPLVENEILN